MKWYLLLFAFTLTLTLTCGASIDYSTDDENWDIHKRQYGLQFSEAEDSIRFRIFKDNLIQVAILNLQDPTHHRGPGPYTHLTHEEFKDKMALNRQGEDIPAETILELLSRFMDWFVDKFIHRPIGWVQDAVDALLAHLPRNETIISKGDNNYAVQRPIMIHNSWDWRKEGVLSSVKKQGDCGSCWAFSTVSVVEACHAIKNKAAPITLSTEQLVDCIPEYGCSGGDPETALDWIIKNDGIATAADYPDTSSATNRTSPCRSDVRNETEVRGYRRVTPNVDSILEAVQDGPVVALIDVNRDATSLKDYRSGIVNRQTRNSKIKITDLSHAVVIVGYGREDGFDYWIVKNSWGSAWGEGGFFRILRSGGQGLLGINLYVVQVDC